MVGLSLIVLTTCSNSDEQINQIVSPDGVLEGTSMTQAEVKQMFLERMADLGPYDVIVTDADGWDMMFYQIRDRANRNVVSYRGLLGYYSGANYYEGTAGAVWDYENNIFSSTCLDSSWNGGHINYVMPLQGYTSEGIVTLKGPYYYLENPNRLNRIYAWVFDGAFPYINPDPTSLNGKIPPLKTNEEIAEYLSRNREIGHKMLGDEQ